MAIKIQGTTIINDSAATNPNLGAGALAFNTIGVNNVAVGYQALQYSESNNNVALGYNAGRNLETGSNVTVVGYNAQPTSFNTSNEITLGDTNVTNFRIPGVGVTSNRSAISHNGVFYENAQTVTANYTITNGKNAMSAGPITINSGITVTVGTGETWTVI